MDAGALITIFTAIFGSGALSTVITLLAARFRHDRQVDQLESWTKELELLDRLDQRAGLRAAGQSESSRNLATAVAARTHLNSRIARRIVPAATWEGYLLVAVGFIAGLLGLALGAYGLEGGRNASGSLGNSLLGLVLLACGVLLVLVGANTDGFRTKMRVVIEQTLEGQAETRTLGKLEKKHYWEAGEKPTFPWRYEVVVPPSVKQSFKTYLMNLPTGAGTRAEAEGHGQYDVEAAPDPSASEGAHQV